MEPQNSAQSAQAAPVHPPDGPADGTANPKLAAQGGPADTDIDANEAKFHKQRVADAARAYAKQRAASATKDKQSG